MKLMLFFTILLLKLSFEKNKALHNLLGNYDNKDFAIKNEPMLKNLTVDGFLGFGESKEYTSSGYCVYLDKIEFNHEKEIKVKVTIYKGIFLEEIMYYKGSNEEKKHNEKMEFQSYQDYSEKEAGSYSHSKLYDKCTLYFKIPKLNNKYIYISIPNSTLISKGYILISVNKSFPAWAIALIVIGSVAIFVFIIILYLTKCFSRRDCCKKFNEPMKERKKDIQVHFPSAKVDDVKDKYNLGYKYKNSLDDKEDYNYEEDDDDNDDDDDYEEEDYDFDYKEEDDDFGKKKKFLKKKYYK